MATETQKGVKISTHGTLENTDMKTFKTCFDKNVLFTSIPLKKELTMFVDENGFPKGLPPNLLASVIRCGDVVGDVFLTREGDYDISQLMADFPFLFDDSDSE